jgi:hypothetical protein
MGEGQVRSMTDLTDKVVNPVAAAIWRKTI